MPDKASRYERTADIFTNERFFAVIEEDEREIMDEHYYNAGEVINALVTHGSISFLMFIPNLPLHCLPPLPFPENCKPQKNDPYVLSSPVNVPYCVRYDPRSGVGNL